MLGNNTRCELDRPLVFLQVVERNVILQIPLPARFDFQRVLKR